MTEVARPAGPEQEPPVTAATDIRPATSADIDTLESIIFAHDAPPAGSRPDPPLASGAMAAYFRHLLERGTVLVAEAGGDAIGFGAVVDTGRAVHLADLFIQPGRLGGGVGGRLIDELFGGRWPRTTYASDDPRAMRLYVGAGMVPYWPNFYLIGDARRLVPTGGVTVQRVSADELAATERALTGRDRSADHSLWAARPGDRPVIVRSPAGDTLAVGHSRPRLRGASRWLERLTVLPGRDPVAAIVAGLIDGADDDGQIGACVLGPNPVLPVLLDAGFRIADRDTAMASDPGLIDVSGVVDTGIP